MSPALNFLLFPTAVGKCGLVWSRRGIVALLLPEPSVAQMRRKLLLGYPGAQESEPSGAAARAAEQITVLLRGEVGDLNSIPLDLEAVRPFARRVYELARGIPPGKSLTYGEVAKQLNAPGAARAVGQALGKNPCAIIVPCHRVVAAGGKMGGFSANGGVVTKRRLIELETPKVSTAVSPFSFDPVQAVAHLTAADKKLGRFIQSHGAFTLELKGTASVFQALAEAIVHQQLTGKAAATIWARVCALQSGANRLTPEWVADASVELLRSAGLSNAKALGMRDLASKTLSQHVPTLEELHTLSSAEIIQRLSSVRGIGKWTVEMMLIFRLGRPDVLPIDDYGVRKGYASVFGKAELPTPKELDAYGQRWAPYRTVAAWYLWRAADAIKK